VDLASGPVCVKRALPRLKVQALWEAPVERNRYEFEWFRVAGEAAPGAAPRLLGRDAEAGLFVMEYLEPREHPVWKEQLRQGDARPGFAARVGATLARIHAVTAGREEFARRFPSDAIFHAIRLEPYLVATAIRHPDLADRLHALVRTTAGTKRCLVHGDVSPKNILAGPRGPVFLDAECAWYGDPAFDLAFCLNHLLLKCLWTPAARERFLACFEALCGAYFERADWEPRAALEARAAALIPGLLLARVDGKSPVEYITAEHDKARVRTVARKLLAQTPSRLEIIVQAWQES
jgi:aminoglycoside phosphotransferase (APT) family kinase protein